MRTIVCAEHMGFCFGVQRALSMVQKLDKPVTVLGDLIHNPQEIERLRKQGVAFVKHTAQLMGGTVVLSAHGSSAQRKRKVAERAERIVDATCPHVEKIHDIVRDLAPDTTLIIFGDPNHPEVKAVQNSASHALVITEVADIPQVAGPVALVAQTTQDSTRYKVFSQAVRQLNPTVQVFDTICHATADRQRAARAVAQDVDMMLVIGGKNSANTQRLAQIAGEIVETKHIETAAELLPEWFAGKDRIGVTAGASTPSWIIEEVIAAVRKF
jgi:(E)-4-hydroxy-3-methyl-but-2-enyl pyrophosphate reductase